MSAAEELAPGDVVAVVAVVVITVGLLAWLVWLDIEQSREVSFWRKKMIATRQEADRLNALVPGLNALAPDLQLVVVAYDYEGRSIQEVATQLSIPVDHAIEKLRLARQGLRLAQRSP